MTAFSRRLGVVWFAVALAAAAHAQNPASGAAPFTVDEAVRLAIADNPSLAASIRDIDAAASGVRSARALANPEAVFTPGLSAGGSDTEFLIRQPLEINGVRAARAGVARARLEGTQAQAVITLRNLVFDTKSAYFDLARARELAALARELLTVAEESNRLTRRQVEVGTRPGVDHIQTGIEVARARQQVAQAEGQAGTATATLNTLMGRLAGAPVGELPTLASFSVLLDPTVGDVEQAVGLSAEIRQAQTIRREFQQEARLARAEGRPDLAPQFRAGSVTRGVHDSGFGIGVTLPLLDFGSRRNRIRQANQAAEAQALRIEAARNQVRQDVAKALALHEAAEAIVAGYRAGVLDQAKRLLDASRIGVQAGQTSVLALLEAQRTYRAVQIEYTNALADRAVAAAALERATGAVPSALLPQGRSTDRRSQ